MGFPSTWLHQHELLYTNWDTSATGFVIICDTHDYIVLAGSFVIKKSFNHPRGDWWYHRLVQVRWMNITHWSCSSFPCMTSVQHSHKHFASCVCAICLPQKFWRWLWSFQQATDSLSTWTKRTSSWSWNPKFNLVLCSLQVSCFDLQFKNLLFVTSQIELRTNLLNSLFKTVSDSPQTRPSTNSHNNFSDRKEAWPDTGTANSCPDLICGFWEFMCHSKWWFKQWPWCVPSETEHICKLNLVEL